MGAASSLTVRDASAPDYFPDVYAEQSALYRTRCAPVLAPDADAAPYAAARCGALTR